jgi:hypothetical protein
MKKPSLTISGIADKTGMDRRTIKRRLMEAGLYPPDGHSDAALLEAVKPSVATGSTGTKEDEQYEKWRKLRIKNDKDEGKLVAVELVKQCHSRILARVDQIIEQKLSNEFPSAVAGLDVPACRVYGKRLGDQIRAEMNQLKEEWK